MGGIGCHLDNFGIEFIEAQAVAGFAVGGNGAGIKIYEASPTIKECILRDNVATMNAMCNLVSK